MASYTQANNPIKVDTALGGDALLLQGFTGAEAVSAPFHFALDLVSDDGAIDPASVLRTPMAVTVALADGSSRFVHGVVRSFVQLERSGDLTSYRAEIVPGIWFLSLTSDCAIFQNMSVLEIVEKVLTDNGYADFQLKCAKAYPKREYCVQYRESCLDFISRLLEDEGIFYFFHHTQDKHMLVLTDGASGVQYGPGPTSVRMTPSSGGVVQDDVVLGLVRETAVHTGKVTLADFDYLKPGQQLRATMAGKPKEESYDYPGGFTTHDDGDRYARIRLEAREALHQVVSGESSCRNLVAGCRVDLKEHYRRDLNQSYTLLRVDHAFSGGNFRTPEENHFVYRNHFVGIPFSVQYHPPAATPRPVVRGSQTAMVVGPSGEEIWVDKYGRVKVQFHWDRLGKNDDKSSCWVRVASSWAGKQWGIIQIPRIGQEVIVDFLEGDPDYPIITGRVYNADQMPPYVLPDNQTQSGVKTRSSPKGGEANYNELRFEDKKGSEQILLHAEKDLLTEVENDETRNVLHDRITTITNADTRTVKEGDDSHTVSKGKQTIEVTEGDQAITVGKGKQTVDVKTGDQVVTLGQGNQKVTLTQGNQTITVSQGNQEIVIEMGNQSTKLSMGNQTTKLDLGKSSIDAMQGIELTCGQSSVKIDQSGVTISGMKVKVAGQIQTEITGAMTKVSGDAMLQAKGGVVMLN